jgi:predicted TIM-barrel fold metal-dependent hydrolase
MANLTSMVTTGVFARFPDLKVVFAECGVSWLPFLMWRLDHQYQWLRHELPFYSEKPSWYLRHQVYETTHGLGEVDDPQTLAALIASVGGPDRLLFATDWPHYDAERVDRVADQVHHHLLHLDPHRCAFIDDILENLRTAHRLGMSTVWVSNAKRHIAFVDQRVASVLELPRLVFRYG